MKKIFTKFLYCILILFAIAISLNLLGILISNTTNNNSTKTKIQKQNNNKAYKLVNTEQGLIQTIAFHLLKPLIESRIDYYIKSYGLEEYLKQLQQQTNEQLFKIYDISLGNGKKALCGDEITAVLYEIDATNNKAPQMLAQKILMENKHPKVFKIGTNKIKQLNYAIEGMKEGGERTILIPKDSKDDNLTDQFTSYYVKLLSVKTNYPKSVENLLVFDSNIKNNNTTIKCGDKVEINYTIREHTGSPIITNKTMSFIVGQNKVPVAIELGILNMTSKRSVITPIELLKDLTDFKNNIKYDKNSIKIIDLTIKPQLNTAVNKPLNTSIH